MRAGVLAHSKIIKLLNEQFVNVFVLLGDLPELQQGAKGELVSKLATTVATTLEASVAQGAGRSVNSFVLSPQLELMGHLPYRKPGEPNITEERYVTFLHASLDGKLPEFGEDTSQPSLAPDSASFADLDVAVAENLKVIFTGEKLKWEVLNIFRTPKRGYQDYTVVEIDTTAFQEGGLLVIDISVGSAEPAGSFDLYAGDAELPTEGVPHDALASAWDVPPGKSGTIQYCFNRGKVFKLGGTGSWFSEEGSINAFQAKISVELDRKPESRKVSSARPEQSAEDVMNAFVEAFKNLDAEVILSMLTEDARETFEGDFEDMPEDARTQMSEILSQMEILSSQYVGDEFHFQLRVPLADSSEVSVKMRKVEGIWRIYDVVE